VFVRFVALIKLPLAGKLAAAGNRNARPFSCNSLTMGGEIAASIKKRVRRR